LAFSGIVLYHQSKTKENAGSSIKLFRQSETAFPDYWKMGFLERLLIVERGNLSFRC